MSDIVLLFFMRLSYPLPPALPPPSMMQVVGLSAPDRVAAQARFAAKLSETLSNGGGDEKGLRAQRDRGVTLATELLHGGNYGVAEEANEVIR